MEHKRHMEGCSEWELMELARMRKASGHISSANPLVAFLYLLMRDEVVSSRVEAIADEVLESFSRTSHSDFTNGWLAQHAFDLAERLTLKEGVRLDELASGQGQDGEPT